MEEPSFDSFLKEALRGVLRQELQEAFKAVGILATTSHAEEHYYDVQQAAAYLKIPKSTLYGYTSSRSIPHLKRGKRLVFKQSELSQWLSEGRKKTVAEIEAEVYSSKGRKGGRR